MQPKELDCAKRAMADRHSLRVCLCAAFVVFLAAGSVWLAPVECSQELNLESRQLRDSELDDEDLKKLEKFDKEWSVVAHPR